jgi:hypothetical protein
MEFLPSMSTIITNSTSLSALRAAAPARRPSSLQLMRDSVPLLLCHRRWLSAVVVVGIAYALLEPMQGVVIKRVTDSLSTDQGLTTASLIRYIPWYVLILVGLASLQFLEKSLKGFYDPLVTFDLQKIYLQRRPTESATEVISRLQYDCRDARKAVEVYVRDFPVIGIGVGMLFALQWSLAPEWLPALLMIVVPNLTLTLWLGRPIRRSNHEMFVAVTEVAKVASPDRLEELGRSQQHLYQRLWRRESWMGFSEVMTQFTIWIGCLLVVFAATTHPTLVGLTEVTAGGLALFIANVMQLSKSLVNVGKAYNKYCSTEPALRRALYE